MEVEVFAAEPEAIQLTWRRAVAPVELAWPGGRRTLTGAAGACTISGLPPDDVQPIAWCSGADAGSVEARTGSRPPGAELYRFATVNDLHIGTDHFGLLGRIRERDEAVPHPVRAAAAAVAEAVAWGAQRIVVKGDVVHSSRPHHWAAVADVFGGAPVPVNLICGNHDSNLRSTVDPFSAARQHGLSLHGGVHTLDVPGLRLVLFDSSVPEIDIGRWNHLRDEVCDALAEAGGPAMVLVHHQPQETTIPLYLPRGIPAVAARPFLRAVRRANPRVLGSSGHTHRHRRRIVEGVEWTEVGSPKDYPGTWAGYVVHEGGIRQVVRRVAEPSVIRWTEHTRRCALGFWALWSPGRIEDRCFTKRWVSG